MPTPRDAGSPADPKLRVDDAVVVLGDLQEGIADLARTVRRDELGRSAGGLVRLAELFDLPTIALTIPKRDGSSSVLLPEIGQGRTSYRHIERTSPDSFENADFRNAVAETGRRTLVVCGVATEICVHWLVLSGIANGYRVYVVADACGGLSTRSEEAAFRRFEAAGAVMTSVVSLAGELAGDFTQSPGREAVEIIYRMVAGAT